MDLSAYRIVQEALANVVRHAPGARTHVSVTLHSDELLVLVVNGPAPTPHRPWRPRARGTAWWGCGSAYG